MSRGFISWPGSFQSNYLGPFAKLATLWYDEILIHVTSSSEDLESALERASDEGLISDDTAVELAERWIPLPISVSGVPPAQALANYHASVVQLAAQTSNSNDPALLHSLIWTTHCWSSLAADSPCGFLTTNLEADFLAKCFAPVTPQGFAPFRRLASARIPDLRELSLDRIFELRDLPRFREFQGKLDDLQESSRTDDRSAAGQLLDEIFQHDLDALATAIGPTKHTAMLHAVGSSVPLPIPFPPVALVPGESDLLESFQRQSRFGWLFFQLDVT